MHKVEVQEKQVVLTITIPYKDGMIAQPINPKQVIEAFDLVLIDALEKRIENCAAMLARNLNNVVYSNEYTVMFKKTNGSTHSFNIPSYECMQLGIELLQQKRYDEFCKCSNILRQCQKALYWVDKPEDVGIYSFGNLISVLEVLVSASKTSE